jgi:hypothetical protein
VVSHSFAFRASRRLKFSYKSILPCTAFPSTLVSMLELSPPLPVLLLLRIGGLSRLNTRAIRLGVEHLCGTYDQILLHVGILLSEICVLVSVLEIHGVHII